MLPGRFFVQRTVFEIFEVKGQIYIFGHNSKTIGRIDLEQKRLDSSRRAAQKNDAHTFFRPMHRFRDICDFVFLGLSRFRAGFRMWS